MIARLLLVLILLCLIAVIFGVHQILTDTQVYIYIYIYIYIYGTWGGVVVKALRYCPGIDSR